jgi:hypothetical protein
VGVSQTPADELQASLGIPQYVGDRALQIVLSHEPTWEDLADLRRSRGVRDYRAIRLYPELTVDIKGRDRAQDVGYPSTGSSYRTHRTFANFS